MKSKVIRYEDDEMAIEATVHQATVAMRIERDRLIDDADKAMSMAVAARAAAQAEPDNELVAAGISADALAQQDARLEVRRAFYPYMIATAPQGTLRRAGVRQPWPPDLDAFLALPDEFFTAWWEATYELNLPWFEEKKAPSQEAVTNTTPGSTTSMAAEAATTSPTP